MNERMMGIRRLREYEARAGKAERLQVDAEFVAAELTKAYRILEQAARDLLDVLPEITADAIAVLPERKRLAEVLEGKCTS